GLCESPEPARARRISLRLGVSGRLDRRNGGAWNHVGPLLSAAIIDQNATGGLGQLEAQDQGQVPRDTLPATLVADPGVLDVKGETRITPYRVSQKHDATHVLPLSHDCRAQVGHAIRRFQRDGVDGCRNVVETRDGNLLKELEIGALSVCRSSEKKEQDAYRDLMHRCRSEEHTSELQSRENLVCRLLLDKKTK